MTSRRRRPGRWLLALGTGAVGLWIMLQFAAAFIASHGQQFSDPVDPPAAFGPCWRRVTAPGVDAWWCPGTDGTDSTSAPIVFAHGYGGDREGLRRLSNTLHERTGRGILLPQLAYATGAEPFGGGERESEAIAAALRWVRAETQRDAVVFGFSMGGYAAMRAVANGAPASAIIEDSSFLSSRDVFMFGAARRVHLPSWAWAGLPLAYPAVSKGGHLGDIDGVALAGRRLPVLAIRCRADDTVPLDYQQQLVDVLRAELWIGACDEHTGAFDADNAAYADRVLAFLAPRA